MVLSEETLLRQQRLPFRGATDLLRTVHRTPKFPGALEYSLIRNVKTTKEWNYAEKGLRLDPIILSEQPWTELMESVDSFLVSFYVDVLTYFVQFLVSVVFLNIILGG